MVNQDIFYSSGLSFEKESSCEEDEEVEVDKD